MSMPKLLCIALLILATPLIADDVLYKWVDDDDVTHYSSQPPVDRDYERVSLSAASVVSPDEGLVERAEQPAEAQAPAALPALPEMVQAEPDPAEVAARCEQARENLFWLQERPRIIVRGDDGSETHLDDDERLRMIEETRAFIAENC